MSLRADCACPAEKTGSASSFEAAKYSLSGSETRALATVGAFRVVSPSDFAHDPPARHVSPADWRHLTDQGLVPRESLADFDGVRHVVALTREGKDLLDAHSLTRPDGHRQEYYAGVVKPRELRHDGQIYRLYQEEAAHMEREGGRVTRVLRPYTARLVGASGFEPLTPAV